MSGNIVRLMRLAERGYRRALALEHAKAMARLLPGESKILYQEGHAMKTDYIAHSALVDGANIKPVRWKLTIASGVGKRATHCTITARTHKEALTVAENMVSIGESITLERIP
jgi:hypothetical protein